MGKTGDFIKKINVAVLSTLAIGLLLGAFQNCGSIKAELMQNRIVVLESLQSNPKDFPENSKLVSIVVPGKIFANGSHITVKGDGSIAIQNSNNLKIQRVIDATPTLDGSHLLGKIANKLDVSAGGAFHFGPPVTPLNWSQEQMNSDQAYPADSICQYARTDCAGGLVPNPRDPDCEHYEKPACDPKTVGAPDFFEIGGRRLRIIYIPSADNLDGDPESVMIQIVKPAKTEDEAPDPNNVFTLDPNKETPGQIPKGEKLSVVKATSATDNSTVDAYFFKGAVFPMNASSPLSCQGGSLPVTRTSQEQTYGVCVPEEKAVDGSCANSNYLLSDEQRLAELAPMYAKPTTKPEWTGYFMGNSGSVLSSYPGAAAIPKGFVFNSCYNFLRAQYGANELMYKEASQTVNVDVWYIGNFGWLNSGVVSLCVGRYYLKVPNGGTTPWVEMAYQIPDSNYWVQTANTYKTSTYLCGDGYVGKYKSLSTSASLTVNLQTEFHFITTPQSNSEGYSFLDRAPEAVEAKVAWCELTAPKYICPDDTWTLEGTTCSRKEMCKVPSTPPGDVTTESYDLEDSIQQTPQDIDDVELEVFTTDAEGNALVTGNAESSPTLLDKISNAIKELGNLFKRPGLPPCSGATCTATIGIRG